MIYQFGGYGVDPEPSEGIAFREDYALHLEARLFPLSGLDSDISQFDKLAGAAQSGEEIAIIKYANLLLDTYF